MELDDFQFYTDSAEVPKRMSVRENQCLKCFAIYLNPCYSDYGFQLLFSEAGQSYGATEGRPYEQIKWLTSRELLRPGMQVLDVGCYDGQFLAKLPQNIKKVGIDIDKPAIERGRQLFGEQGVEFILGNFENFQYAGTPDTITMFHVLEHLPRPVAALYNLRSIAHPSTRLVVEVPILENCITNDINGFFSVQHMTHFSRRSLQNCLIQSGWKIQEWDEQPDYNGCRVLAIPDEPATNIIGDERDVDLLYAYLAAWYNALSEVNHKLSSIENTPSYIIWGGGLHTEFLYHTTSFFQSDNNREYAIVDSDILKQGKTWRGITIHPPAVLREVEWTNIQLVVSSYGSQEAIVQSACDLGVPVEQIVRLYDEVRVY
jgi:SAM-dependent methyltransferase